MTRRSRNQSRSLVMGNENVKRVAILFEYPSVNGGENSMLAALHHLTSSAATEYRFSAIAPGSGPLSDRLDELGIERQPLSMFADDGQRRSRDVVEDDIRTAVAELRANLLHGNSLSMGRWLGRVWFLCSRDAADLDGSPVDADSVRDLDRAVHKTIKKVTEDLGAFKFNTSLAALMEWTNTMTAAWDAGKSSAEAWRSATDRLTLMLAPMAPHITEEMWERAGNEYSVHSQDWPKWDAELAADEVITLVVQVNGKVRDRIETPADIAEEAAKELALASEKVAPHTDGKQIAKVIYVPGRLVNIVAH